MSEIALVRATFGDDAEAQRIADAVIAERLAACANLGDCRSTFRWDDAVAAERETVGLFKTTVARAPRLVERIAALHGYDLPAIEWWPARTSEAVADWVTAATGD